MDRFNRHSPEPREAHRNFVITWRDGHGGLPPVETARAWLQSREGLPAWMASVIGDDGPDVKPRLSLWQRIRRSATKEET